MSHLSERLERIRSLKKELGLHFALIRHFYKPKPELSLMLDMRRVEQELESARAEIQTHASDSPEENACLTRIRTLEDQRFQILSRLNGNHISAYSTT